MTKQYSVLKGYFVALGSLLAGASVVHSIFKPDLHIPIDACTSHAAKRDGSDSKGEEK
jgi:hypothetical protein